MRILLIICAICVVVIHYNQDMNWLYWYSLITFFTCGFIITYKLDHERIKKSDKADR